MWYWYQNRYINQWDKTKSPEINPCIYCQLTSTIVPRLYSGEFIVFLTNSAETCGYPHLKMNLEPYSYHVQNNSKQIKDLNVRADIVKLLKENRDVYTHDFSQTKLSFKTTKPQGTFLNLFRLSQKNATNWVAYKQQKFIFHSLDADKSKIMALADSVWWLVRAYFLIHIWCLLVMSSHGENGQEPLWGLFSKVCIAVHEGSTLITKVFYKPSKTIISGVLGFQCVSMTRSGGTHIQTTIQPKVINWTLSILKTLEYQKTLSRK